MKDRAGRRVTDRPDLGLAAGRINITLRESGLGPRPANPPRS